MLMAHPRTLMRSGALRAVAYCGRFVPEVPCIFGLGALLTIIGALHPGRVLLEPHYRSGHGQ